MRAVRGGALLVLSLACNPRGNESVERWVSVAADRHGGVDLGEVVITPKSALATRRVEGGRLLLGLSGDDRVTIHAPFACPVDVEAGAGRGGVVERKLLPLFELGPAFRVVGFDQPFEVRAEPACAAAQGATVELSVAGGAPLARHVVTDGGRTLRGTTGGPPPLAPGLPSGVVPVSAHERAATRIEARLRLPDGRTRVRELEVSATSRASGLTTVALDHRVLLRGEALRLSERPKGSTAELRNVGSLFELVPDVTGRFVVTGATAERSVIEAGRYDEVPLDCGRSDCHRALTASAASSPMTHALANDLGPRGLTDPSCTLACHASGEPGSDDGGFVDVLSDFGGELPPSYKALPRALRRLGGVGCLACHGPSAIPPPGSRFAVLGSGVCAVCHDAPPRYGHVRAFAGTRMARADRDPRTREGSCARCHTTFGALGRETYRPPSGTSLGIGCTACHDVHPHAPDGSSSSAPTARLIRELPLPSTLGAVPPSMLGSSRVCLGCHAPSEGAAWPEATAAAVLLGRGGSSADGGPLAGVAPHAGDARGCLSCHASGPEGLGRGAAHAFAVGAERCASCHADTPRRDPTLAARAASLLDRIGRSASKSREIPAHAAPPARPEDPARARAFANVALVIEDPAADVHNPRFATLLLDTAEQLLAPSSSGTRTTHAP